MVAGTIIGTIIGGASTIGTAQLAFTLGLSAWWFTLGSGAALFILGLFYAKPLRNSGLTTVPEFLVVNYGKGAGPLCSLTSSAGIFFSLVSNILAAIPLIVALLHFSEIHAAGLIFFLILAYVFFGGVWGTGIVGVFKTILILLCLGVSTIVAWQGLGGAAGMDFSDFFWYQGRPGIFWVVEAGAAVSALILFMLFRDCKGSVDAGEKPPVEGYFPTVLLVGMVALLAGASLLPEKPALTNGFICMWLFLIGLIPQAAKGGLKAVRGAFAAIDLTTLALLAGVFIVVGGVQAAGLLDVISSKFATLGGGNLCLVYTAVVWGSVLCSAFIDNIPYVAAMLPVTAQVSAILGVEPTLLYFGLLIGATLGGNLTPVGASANITAIGILRREGYEVKNRDFLRIGLPFTLAAVCTGYALLWLIWA